MATDDPFDPEALSLLRHPLQGFSIATPTVPQKHWFIRVHPDKQYHLRTAVIDMRTDCIRQIYLVKRDLWPVLMAEKILAPCVLTTAINRQGAVFLWPIRPLDFDYRFGQWGQSAIRAAAAAAQQWVRVTPNMEQRCYDFHVAQKQLDEPKWPNMSFGDILRESFKHRFIECLDDPILRKLRGEA